MSQLCDAGVHTSAEFLEFKQVFFSSHIDSSDFETLNIDSRFNIQSVY